MTPEKNIAGNQSLLDDIIDALEIERDSNGEVEVPRGLVENLARKPKPATESTPRQSQYARRDTRHAPPHRRIREPETTAPPATTRQNPRGNAPPIAAIAQLDWDTLKNTAKSCQACPLANKRRNVVFGAGNTNAELMFIGEGPGREEDEQGVPFVGPAGALLTKMINAMRFQRSEVYIANILKCRPPGNRNPEDPEVEQCVPFLLRQIEIVSPKVIVLLGAVPLKHLMGKTGITRLHGNWMEFRGIRVMPTFHPAYLLRTPEAKKHAWQDLQKVMDVLGKTPRAPTARR